MRGRHVTQLRTDTLSPMLFTCCIQDAQADGQRSKPQAGPRGGKNAPTCSGRVTLSESAEPDLTVFQNNMEEDKTGRAKASVSYLLHLPVLNILASPIAHHNTNII